jgi:MFS family permease
MLVKKWLGAGFLILVGIVAGGGLGLLAAAAALALANAANVQSGVVGTFAMLALPGGAVAGAVITTWLVARRMGPAGQGRRLPLLAAAVLVMLGIFVGGAAGYLAGWRLDEWLYHGWGPVGDQRDGQDDLLALIRVYSGLTLGAVLGAVASTWAAARLAAGGEPRRGA